MKRILTIILCAMLIFALASCKNNKSNNENTHKKNDHTVSDRYERTVYVSKSGKKVHSIPNCSGMKYYYEMSYSDAKNAGYDFCDNCN